MKLTVEFDDALLLKRAKRKQEALFVIYWSDGSTCYPSPNWIDFGGVVLGWWMVEFAELAADRSCEFRFMDGPYRLSLIAQGDRIAVSSAETIWHSMFAEVRSELGRAGAAVVSRFESLGVFRDTCRSLEMGIDRLA